MSDTLHLRVITPSSTLLDAQGVAWVRLFLADGGSISIWPLHSPLLAANAAGAIYYADETGEHAHDVSAGIFTVRDNQVTILMVDSQSSLSVSPNAPDGIEIEQYERLAQFSDGEIAGKG